MTDQHRYSRFSALHDRTPVYALLGLWLTVISAPLAGAQAQNPPPAQQPPPAKAAPQAPATQAPPPTNTSPIAYTPEFRKGAIYGRVLDSSGKPVQDATVALQDRDGKVLAWTKTNAQGEYALAADPMTALVLRPSRRRGLLEQCARAVGDVVTAPVKIVGNAVANPGQTIKAAAVSVGTGTPAPLAAQAAVPVLGDKSIGDETGKNARDTAVKTAAGENPNAKGKKPVVEKGEALLLVNAPNFKEAKGKAGAYWLDGPVPDKEKPLGMQAWLETVKLAPASSDKSSEIVQEALTLTDPFVEPTLVPAGDTVKLKVRLQSPPGGEHKVRVFAREARKEVVVELLPQEGQDKNLFVGMMTLDPKTPAGETTLTIAALRAEPVEVNLDKKKADPLVLFVKRLDDMKADKPYQYDPRIMASENRLDIKLTVLDVKKGTPAAPPSSPAPARGKG